MGLPVCCFTNSFFDFSWWCYFNILFLVALHLLCCFLNPISTFIVLHIFLPYFRPEFSSFFLIWYHILFRWFSIQFLTELWLATLEHRVWLILLYSVLVSLYIGSFCFNPLLKLFSSFFIPFLFDLIQIIQPYLPTFLSQNSCLPSFSETNISAMCIFIWRNSSLQNRSPLLLFLLLLSLTIG